jgi:hypothetical protein
MTTTDALPPPAVSTKTSGAIFAAISGAVVSADDDQAIIARVIPAKQRAKLAATLTWKNPFDEGWFMIRRREKASCQLGANHDECKVTPTDSSSDYQRTDDLLEEVDLDDAGAGGLGLAPDLGGVLPGRKRGDYGRFPVVGRLKTGGLNLGLLAAAIRGADFPIIVLDDEGAVRIS